MMQRRWREPQVPPSFYGGGETFLYSIERLPDLPPLPVGEAAPPGEAPGANRGKGPRFAEAHSRQSGRVPLCTCGRAFGSACRVSGKSISPGRSASSLALSAASSARDESDKRVV